MVYCFTTETHLRKADRKVLMGWIPINSDARQRSMSLREGGWQRVDDMQRRKKQFATEMGQQHKRVRVRGKKGLCPSSERRSRLKGYRVALFLTDTCGQESIVIRHTRENEERTEPAQMSNLRWDCPAKQIVIEGQRHYPVVFMQGCTHVCLCLCLRFKEGQVSGQGVRHNLLVNLQYDADYIVSCKRHRVQCPQIHARTETCQKTDFGWNRREYVVPRNDN